MSRNGQGWLGRFCRGGMSDQWQIVRVLRQRRVLLQTLQVEVRRQAVNIWQAYISEFQRDTFPQGVRKNLWVHTRDPTGRQALDQGRL